MTKNRIQIDQAALQRAVQPQIDRLQEQLNQQLRATVGQVRDEMEGQPAGQVYNELVSRLQRDVPGLEINETTLRTVAAEIEAGTLS